MLYADISLDYNINISLNSSQFYCPHFAHILMQYSLSYSNKHYTIQVGKPILLNSIVPEMSMHIKNFIVVGTITSLTSISIMKFKSHKLITKFIARVNKRYQHRYDSNCVDITLCGDSNGLPYLDNLLYKQLCVGFHIDYFKNISLYILSSNNYIAINGHYVNDYINCYTAYLTHYDQLLSNSNCLIVTTVSYNGTEHIHINYCLNNSTNSYGEVLFNIVTLTKRFPIRKISKFLFDKKIYIIFSTGYTDTQITISVGLVIQIYWNQMHFHIRFSWPEIFDISIYYDNNGSVSKEKIRNNINYINKILN